MSSSVTPPGARARIRSWQRTATSAARMSWSCSRLPAAPASPRRAAGSFRAEMQAVPLHRAHRMLVIHVHVVEALGGARLRVLDHRAVRPAQIPEAALPRRLRPFRPQFENLLLRWKTWQRVARHVHERAVRSVPHLRDLQAHRRGSDRCTCASWAYSTRSATPRSAGRSVRSAAASPPSEQDVDVAGLDRLEAVVGRLRRDLSNGLG